MKRSSRACVAIAVVLSACTTVAPPEGGASAQKQLNFQLASGAYRCASGLRVDIQRDPVNADVIELHWRGSRYTLQRTDSSSGLPRYEDRSSGLVWIDLPWKSVLVDSDSGRPLANECRTVAS